MLRGNSMYLTHLCSSPKARRFVKIDSMAASNISEYVLSAWKISPGDLSEQNTHFTICFIAKRSSDWWSFQNSTSQKADRHERETKEVLKNSSYGVKRRKILSRMLLSKVPQDLVIVAIVGIFVNNQKVFRGFFNFFFGLKSMFAYLSNLVFTLLWLRLILNILNIFFYIL